MLSLLLVLLSQAQVGDQDAQHKPIHRLIMGLAYEDHHLDDFKVKVEPNALNPVHLGNIKLNVDYVEPELVLGYGCYWLEPLVFRVKEYFGYTINDFRFSGIDNLEAQGASHSIHSSGTEDIIQLRMEAELEYSIGPVFVLISGRTMPYAAKTEKTDGFITERFNYIDSTVAGVIGVSLPHDIKPFVGMQYSWFYGYYNFSKKEPFKIPLQSEMEFELRRRVSYIGGLKVGPFELKATFGGDFGGTVGILGEF